MEYSAFTTVKNEERSLYAATSIAAGAIGPQSVVIAPLLVSILISGMHLPGNIAGLILSAELTGHYKTDPEVYLKAADLLSLQPQEVMMVAAHTGDLRASSRIGFRTAYVPRPLERGPGRPVNTNPDGEFDVTASDFIDLAVKLGA